MIYFILPNYNFAFHNEKKIIFYAFFMVIGIDNHAACTENGMIHPKMGRPVFAQHNIYSKNFFLDISAQKLFG